MKRATKAALLSAFLLPGVGHFYLRAYATASALVVAALAALYLLVSNAVKTATLITDKILSGEIQADIPTIMELAAQQAVGSDAQLITFATNGLVIVWLIGIVDSYRVGRLQERNSGAGG